MGENDSAYIEDAIEFEDVVKLISKLVILTNINKIINKNS